MSDTRVAVRLSALALAMFVAACGGGESGGETETEGGAAGGGAAVQNPVDAATAGSIGGTITFAGTAPANPKIDMAEEAKCAAKHTTPPTKEEVVVGANKGLANVFVYVKSGPGTTLTFPTPTEAVELDQEGCVYTPHVMALQTGQTLHILNSDSVAHNINAKPTAQRGFNASQPMAGMTKDVTFATQEVMIPVVCDIHGWMQSYIGVTSHPYHTVTTADGAFTIPNLPPGDYEVVAWHEKYGEMTSKVTVPASGKADANFEFKAGTAAVVPMGAPLHIHADGSVTRDAAAHTHSQN
jgi:plastocyanin